MAILYKRCDIVVLLKWLKSDIVILLRGLPYAIVTLSVRHSRLENVPETSMATRGKCFRQIEGRTLDIKSTCHVVLYGVAIALEIIVSTFMTKTNEYCLNIG